MLGKEKKTGLERLIEGKDKAVLASDDARAAMMALTNDCTVESLPWLKRRKLRKLLKREKKLLKRVGKWDAMILKKEERIAKKDGKKLNKKVNRTKQVQYVKKNTNRTEYIIIYIKNGFSRRTAVSKTVYDRVMNINEYGAKLSEQGLLDLHSPDGLNVDKISALPPHDKSVVLRKIRFAMACVELKTASGYSKILDMDGVIDANSNADAMTDPELHTLSEMMWISTYTAQTHATIILIMLAFIPMGFLLWMAIVWAMKGVILGG